MHPAIPTTFLFLGCCTDVIFLELLITEDPGSGNIITCARFLFIALEGFIFTSHFGTKKSVVPIRKYVMLVIFVFLTSVLNNLVLNFNISMPLHMIFRSGSLITSLLLGVVVLKRSYIMAKYISVLMITIGVATCTVESGKYVQQMVESSSDSFYDLMVWCAGVVLMTLSLFLSAQMGIYQELLSMEYGKNPREALFFSHALPLPGFLVLGKDIYNRALLYNASEKLQIPFLEMMVPKMWWFLFVNVVTNHVCSTSAFMLSAEATSLTVTLAITLRKFVSLMLSIIYFKNPFTMWHWVGTILVFIGTLLFTEVIKLPFLNYLIKKEDQVKPLKSD